MYTTKQIVSYILDRMGYKRISKFASSINCTNEDIDTYINLIKLSVKKDYELVQFINYHL